MNHSRLPSRLALSLATLAALASAPAWAQIAATTQPAPTAKGPIAKGAVFSDSNRNGTRDPGEPGLANIRVSDGYSIVSTGPDGTYTLPLASDDVTIFVLKPRDFATPIDNIRIPRFYHHHAPAGTPDESFLFSGLEPTGPLPASVDFPLIPSPEPDKFRIVLFGDPQAYTTLEQTYYARDVVSEFARLGPDVAFGFGLGDLVGDNLDLLQPYNESNALAGFTWYNVIGNHDLNFDAKTDTHSDATFRRVYGPSSYAFQYGQAHFLVLNNVYWEGFDGLRADGHAKRGQYKGALRPHQLQFIKSYVDTVPTDQPIVILTHIPLYSGEEGKPAPGAHTAEFQQLLKILSKHPNTFSANGHTHYNLTTIIDQSKGFQGPPGTAHIHHNVATISGTWYAGMPDERGIPLSMQRDGSYRGYAIAEFDGPKFSVRYQPLGRPETEQIRIHAPDVVLRSKQSVPLLANVFDASQRSTVRFRLLAGDGQSVLSDWTPMTVTRAVDPVYAAQHAASVEWAKAAPGRRALSAPVALEHMFTAEIPADHSSGLYCVEVQTTNTYGHTFTARHPLRFVESPSEFADIDAKSSRVPRPGSRGALAAATRPTPTPITPPVFNPAAPPASPAAEPPAIPANSTTPPTTRPTPSN